MDSGNGIHVLRPRVAVTKVAVSDKRNRYIFIICLSIEHGLGNKGMHCVTQGADAKVGVIDKGSGHISIICLSIEHGLGNKGMHCVTQGADTKVGVIDKGSGHIIHFYIILIKSLNVALNNIIKIIKILEVKLC